MCLPFLNLSVWYDALLRGWCVAYVGDVTLVSRYMAIQFCSSVAEDQVLRAVGL
jgi:hypothetical protein